MAGIPNIALAARLEGILSTPARLRIARLLVQLPEKEFTGREIARLLGVSPSTVHVAMRILASHGLALQRAVGRAYVFQVNSKSYLYTILKELFESEDAVGRELTQELRNALRHVAVSAVAFGSYARGTARRSSDLDLLVITDVPEPVKERLARLESLFLRRYGLHVDAKVLTPSELRAKASLPFIKAARAEGVLILGEPIDKVIARGA